MKLPDAPSEYVVCRSCKLLFIPRDKTMSEGREDIASVTRCGWCCRNGDPRTYSERHRSGG